MNWMRPTDLSRQFADQYPIIRTFQPGANAKRLDRGIASAAKIARHEQSLYVLGARLRERGIPSAVACAAT